LARGDGAVAARLELDDAAASGDPNLLASGDAEAPQFGRGEAGHRLGLELVEHARQAGYRPGMPMFELAAGRQYHRVFGVGFLGGRYDRGRNQSPAA
jgi:hypothetical protein